jgi:hypothetical protein
MAPTASLGDRAKVGTFERCQAVSEKEIGVEPAAETRAEYELLLKGETNVKLDLSSTQVVPARRTRSMSHRARRTSLQRPAIFRRGRCRSVLWTRTADRQTDSAPADSFLLKERGGDGCSVIVGSSGSGKSSIVRAGLIPALKRGQPLPMGYCLPTAFAVARARHHADGASPRIAGHHVDERANR